MTVILGIDPGISGALAFCLDNRQIGCGIQLITTYDMPLLDGDVDAHAICQMIKIHQPDVAIIERVHPHPKEGVSSVWRFAAAFATVCTAVALSKIPLTQVSPAKWKKAMGVKGGAEGKEQCRRLVIEMLPHQREMFERKKDHGRAEAVLIARYATTLNTLRNYEVAR
jgi:crossover junction endodeoxyribonuclease RuvC